MGETKRRAFKHFVGIDVSKDTLDIALMSDTKLLEHCKIANEPLAIKSFLTHLKSIENLKLSNCLFGLEFTGIYGNYLLEALTKAKANVVQEHPLQIKKSLGLTRGKNDKVDSIRIGQFLRRYDHAVNLWEPKRKVIQQLATLSTLRARMVNHSQALTKPLKEDIGFLSKEFTLLNKQLCADSIVALKSDIAKIDLEIQNVCNSDERVMRLMELALSVPCIGPVTAVQIIVTTNEFKDISTPQKFACYSGVAPFQFASGSSVYKPARVSFIANKKMKTLLHICAVSAIRTVPDIKAYYLKKTLVEGKHKMLVLNAVRFKLITRVFACVMNNRLYQTTYTLNDNYDK